MSKLYYLYPSAGHVITGSLNVVPDAKVRNIISKGPKYRLPSNIDFSKCRREITASLNDFSNHWCKRKNVEPDALKKWKINTFKIIDTLISFYSRNTHLLPPKIVSEYDQEIPQSQTADNPVAPRGRDAQPSRDIRHTNQAKQPALSSSSR